MALTDMVNRLLGKKYRRYKRISLIKIRKKRKYKNISIEGLLYLGEDYKLDIKEAYIEESKEATIEDISKKGFGIYTQEPIKEETHAWLVIQNVGTEWYKLLRRYGYKEIKRGRDFPVDVKVVYCEQKESNYRVGLEITDRKEAVHK